MLLARVRGQMVATVKLDCFVGEKLLVVEPVDPTGKADGSEIIACDRAGAGVGDVVLLLQEGGSCRAVMGKKDAPVEALVVAVVDRIDL
ncbi:MAG TPA: EutN/CcmL family microcompartment protein [Symbiobacteriaceae bacterium]|nr:EutN/CcmL family microcompartment protein [Symbiobacteriaceae bacterium]